MKMPPPDQAALKKRATLLKRLRRIVAPENVIDDLEGLKAYENDGLTAYGQVPMLVVLPETTQEVSEVLKLCTKEGVKIVPRGAGTGLSGGALPLADGITVGLSKFKEILDIDYVNRTATVQPGVTNLAISQAVEGEGFY